MSKIRVLPLDFHEQAGMLIARDRVLFEAVQKFCNEELKDRPNFGMFQKVWAAVSLDEPGNIDKVVGITGIRTVVDCSLFRATDTQATVKLSNRINDYLADTNQLGQEMFLYVNPDEAPEQRCANWGSALEHWGAKPANRQVIAVR